MEDEKGYVVKDELCWCGVDTADGGKVEAATAHTLHTHFTHTSHIENKTVVDGGPCICNQRKQQADRSIDRHIDGDKQGKHRVEAIQEARYSKQLGRDISYREKERKTG